ncbi:NACHT domain-containing protein [Magnetospira sp. QH-2]|uniref:NACHT domain-containing protein n=1 Tax=Magnetospira sp. (strain QH-2) TaxID=1288970 RepID=UPI0009E52E49|nr:NACHT domain-containing protein [Magnetospira sp. QH-2]
MADKVRASRDGHEYHEAWTARKSMQLLLPDDDFVAMAIEGLALEDEKGAKRETIEIADLTLYYGRGASFESSERTTIAQFKYSVADSDPPFRASHARKTVSKFAVAFKDHKERYGDQAVHQKLGFELITNRPIYAPLLAAIEAIAAGSASTGEEQEQAKQFKAAAGLHGQNLREFAAKCSLIGRTGNLTRIDNELARLMIDWSATNDALADARLKALKKMVRDKAGTTGHKDKVIKRTDVLASLLISELDDLLPCPSALADFGKVVEREQLADAASTVSCTSDPVMVHASGGTGKTVFMDSLASALSHENEVVFFDCFGGGAYRSPEDARHLTQKGLVHIANTLAFKGMCDPILPGSSDEIGLFTTFRRRLKQSLQTMQALGLKKGLAIFIDAIDNAERFALERGERSFPNLLLESLHSDPIPGVKLIVSCRPERKPNTFATCQEIELLPFTINETEIYLRSRLKNASKAEINVGQARSGGNARILEHLVKSDRGLLDPSEIDNKVELDDLIQERISKALETAVERGHTQEELNSFLAGLAVLPPPVPLDEYAGAHGFNVSTVESFAADLCDLLERTKHGLTFRDEPTELLVHDRYSSSPDALKRLAENLNERQGVSVYAARALPGLLFKLDDGEQLFKLAFDERVPDRITSKTGKRNIRYARLKSAALHAAINKNHNRLVRLLVELSAVAAEDQRGIKYILDFPDLVVAAKDIDATRRLFETRTAWPGMKHARLTIAHALTGDTEQAYRHAVLADEWIDHYRRRDREEHGPREAGPEQKDIAAIPFFRIAAGRSDEAAQYFLSWPDWFTFKVCRYVIECSNLASTTGKLSSKNYEKFIRKLPSIGSLTAALCFEQFSKAKRKTLVRKLATQCGNSDKLDLPVRSYLRPGLRLDDGLRKASAVAAALGMAMEAQSIVNSVSSQIPGIWSFRDEPYTTSDVFPFLFNAALQSATSDIPLHEKDLLPSELALISSEIDRSNTGKEFSTEAAAIIDANTKKPDDEEKGRSEGSAFGYEEAKDAKRYVSEKLPLVLELTSALAEVLAADGRSVGRAFKSLVDVWEKTRNKRDIYRAERINRFFEGIGFEAAMFVLWSRPELPASAVTRFLAVFHAQSKDPYKLTRIVSELARRPALHEKAGEQALIAREWIDAENEVTQRASLMGDLGRAMLPASIEEATIYFRDGLEQMDAIGSGDYEFTNELLLFASEMKGEELEEREFHTLTNICELNMGEEPENYFWGAVAGGLSQAAGPRGLAKISRWDDRSRISLEYTLLPYLTALVTDGKIAPNVALALNELADPVELWSSGTKEFATAIHNLVGKSRPDLIRELITQYKKNNPGVSSGETTKLLASLAEEVLGDAPLTSYLGRASKQYSKVIDTLNYNTNYRGRQNEDWEARAEERRKESKATIKSIVHDVNPLDPCSLAKACKDFKGLNSAYEFKDKFFGGIRKKVPYQHRRDYLIAVCDLEDFNFHWKLEELQKCREIWGRSSSSIQAFLGNAANGLLHRHADDLLNNDRLSSYQLNKISDLTGVPIADLIVELVQVFARQEGTVPGSLWLTCAIHVCSKADDGQGQIALGRLLRSDFAKLANGVVDGAWSPGLYPEDDVGVIAANLIWRCLGAPKTEQRWRAAHSVRTLAKFQLWDIIDVLVNRFDDQSAGAFQANELPFFFLHARLWLLIALARAAIDHPTEIARYQDTLVKVALTEKGPHAQMRQFAARALLVCIDSGSITLDTGSGLRLRSIDLSPFPLARKSDDGRSNFYGGRPKSVPEPEPKFYLDYDFQKHEVDGLGRVFGRPCWEVSDMVSGIVREFDSEISHMSDGKGREARLRSMSGTISNLEHSYGHQLGLHALMMVAGGLLESTPVVQIWEDEVDPWGEWMRNHSLTRTDGFWLSDGMDSTPLDTAVTLKEATDDGLQITGNRQKLLALIGIKLRIGKQLVVDGYWYSADNIRVGISSALARPEETERLIQSLIDEDPMLVWVPSLRGYESDDEFDNFGKTELIPWLVHPQYSAHLDELDPYGAICAQNRPRLANEFNELLALSRDDSFGRAWKNKSGSVAVFAEAWGKENSYTAREVYSGLRFSCTSTTLKQVLNKANKDLVILINLQEYEEGWRGESGKYTHTVGVVRVTNLLDFSYYPGKVNHLYVPRY